MWAAIYHTATGCLNVDSHPCYRESFFFFVLRPSLDREKKAAGHAECLFGRSKPYEWIVLLQDLPIDSYGASTLLFFASIPSSHVCPNGR